MLTHRQVERARELLATGLTDRQAARATGHSRSTIANIRRDQWAPVWQARRRDVILRSFALIRALARRARRRYRPGENLPLLEFELSPEEIERLEQVRAVRRQMAAALEAAGREVDRERWGTPPVRLEAGGERPEEATTRAEPRTPTASRLLPVAAVHC